MLRLIFLAQFVLMFLLAAATHAQQTTPAHVPTPNEGDFTLHDFQVRRSSTRSDSEVRPVPKFSQQDLASMIGLTRQRVNVLMKRFRKLRYVDNARGFGVHRSLVKVD